MQRFNFEVRLKQDSDEKSILSSSSRPVAVAVPDERGPYVLWEAAKTEIEQARKAGVSYGHAKGLAEAKEEENRKRGWQ